MATNRTAFFNSTTGSTSSGGTSSFTNHLTLTFTPSASTNYFVMASSILDFSGGTQDVTWQLVETTPSATTFATNTHHDQGGCDHGIYRWTSGSAVSTTFAIQHNGAPSSSSSTASFGSILVLEQGSNDQYASSDTLATTTSTSFTAKTTLTFTVPSTGNYLLIAYAEVQNNASLDAGVVKLSNGGTDYGQASIAGSFLSYRPWSTVVMKSLSSGSNTTTIQYKSSTGSGTTSIRNARIIALRLSDFYNSYDQQIRTSHTDSTGSFVTVPSSTLTATTQAFDHITIGAGQFIPTNTSTNGGRIVVNGATKGSPITVTSTNAYCYFFPWKETLTGASHSWSFQQENAAASEIDINTFQITGLQYTNSNMFIAF